MGKKTLESLFISHFSVLHTTPALHSGALPASYLPLSSYGGRSVQSKMSHHILL